VVLVYNHGANLVKNFTTTSLIKPNPTDVKLLSNLL